MRKNLYSDLSKDLLHLYAFTGHKEIETLFVECQANNAMSSEAFISSLPASLDGVSGEVISALKTLLVLKAFVAKDGTLWGLLNFIAKNQSIHSQFSLVKIFGDFFASGKYADLLSPFAMVFNSARSISSTPDLPLPEPAVTQEQIADSLQILESSLIGSPNKAFEDLDERIPKRKETKREKLDNLFAYLATVFSDELRSAATDAGQTELAKHLTPETIADTLSLGKYLTMPGNVMRIRDFANNVIKDIMKSLMDRDFEEQYKMARAMALLCGEKITRKQYLDFHNMSLINHRLQRLFHVEKKPSEIDLPASALLNSGSIIFVSFLIAGMAKQAG